MIIKNFNNRRTNNLALNNMYGGLRACYDDNCKNNDNCENDNCKQNNNNVDDNCKKVNDNCKQINLTTTVKKSTNDNCKKPQRRQLLRNYKDIAGLGFPAGILIVFTHEIIQCPSIPNRKSPWGGVSYRQSVSPSYEASGHVNNYAYSGKLLYCNTRSPIIMNCWNMLADGRTIYTKWDRYTQIASTHEKPLIRIHSKKSDPNTKQDPIPIQKIGSVYKIKSSYKIHVSVFHNATRSPKIPPPYPTSIFLS